MGTVPDRFRVALTIDAEFPDRPTEPGVTARILDILAEDGVTATFFIQGRWAEAEPVLARRIAAEGHLVANHSHHHARMTLMTAAGIARDARAAERAILAATGRNPRPWFRCPFGAGAQARRVVDRLDAIGYVDVGWHVDGRDWAGGGAVRLEARLVRGTIAHGDGAVVLVHGWPRVTPVALRGAIGQLRDRGAAFVGIDALDVLPGRRSTAMAAPSGTDRDGMDSDGIAGGHP
jgi:peptidoglycan/xylan/chitin deacetylase (PgdA/CDA1 family)